MGIRISTTLDLTAGLNNDLAEKVFGGSGVVSQLLDTLEHAATTTYQIAASDTEAIDFGDITSARYIYIEGDSEFSIAFAATLATAGQVLGVSGTYPTGFVGGETLNLLIDGIAIAIVFDVADQTRDQVIARINFVAALTNAAFVANPIALRSGLELLLQSTTTGPTSTVEVVGGTALVTLGLSAGTGTGDAAEPGTSDVQVLRPADPTGASAAEGVKAFFHGTVEAAALQVTNLSLTAALNITVFLAGDLVADV